MDLVETVATDSVVDGRAVRTFIEGNAQHVIVMSGREMSFDNSSHRGTRNGSASNIGGVLITVMTRKKRTKSSSMSKTSWSTSTALEAKKRAKRRTERKRAAFMTGKSLNCLGRNGRASPRNGDRNLNRTFHTARADMHDTRCIGSVFSGQRQRV